MNYIKEINSFYDWLETNSVSDSAINLWHGLLHVNNKASKNAEWKEEFPVAISTLQVKTSLSKSSIIRARNLLKQLGRIDFKERKGNQSCIYKIIAFHTDTQIETQSGTQSVTQTDTQSETQNDTINKLNLNKTKPSFEKEAKQKNIQKENSEEQTELFNPEEEEKEKSSAKKEKEVIEHFHIKCSRLPKVQIINQSRKKSINARLKDFGIEKVKEVFEMVGESNFLNGENKQTWSADFDWIMKPTNFAKILEGNYKNKENGQSNNHNTNNGFNNQKGNSFGGAKVSGKIFGRTLLARELDENSSGDSKSGNFTFDAEIIE